MRTGPARDTLSEKTDFQGVTMDAISIIAEQRIREACERGDFDSLPGAGKPLELEDDSHIIYVNGAYQNPNECGLCP